VLSSRASEAHPSKASNALELFSVPMSFNWPADGDAARQKQVAVLNGHAVTSVVSKRNAALSQLVIPPFAWRLTPLPDPSLIPFPVSRLQVRGHAHLIRATPLGRLNGECAFENFAN
jgi:hypothetical protein